MKEERYPSLHFYTWGTVIFVLLVYKFYAPINANSAANFSVLIRRAFSSAVSISITPEHSPHHIDHYLLLPATDSVMLQIPAVSVLQTVQMRLTVLQRMIFVSLNNGRLDSLHFICLVYFR